MIRPRALRATLALLLAPLAARACPEPSLSCIPRYHLALDQESGGGLAVTRGEAATTNFALGLGADFFVLDNLSVGVRGGARAERSDDEWLVAWGVGVRAGYNIPLSRRWSFWPRVGVGFDNTPRAFVHNGPYAPTIDTLQYRTIAIELFAPVVVHPNRHFFVGFGPQLSQPVYVHANGVVNPLSNATYGLQLLVGGHF